MKHLVLTAAALVGLAVGQAQATRCSNLGSYLFCDDFDGYADNWAMWSTWPLVEPWCDGVWSDHTLVKPGHNGSIQQLTIWQGNQNPPRVEVSRHQHDLTPHILVDAKNTLDLPYVNGGGEISIPLTAANTIPADYVDSFNRSLRPDALKGEFIMTFDNASYSNMIYYTELFLDNDRAPTSFDMVYCPAAETRGPVANPRMRKSDGQVHASFAIGIISILDREVCDLDSGWNPTTWRLAVYDGLTWNFFQAPQFGIPQVPDDGADLMPAAQWNQVRFAIGADYVEVRLRNARSESQRGAGKIPNAWFVARVPRQYKGPFNKIAIGPGHGRDLSTPTCENFSQTATPNMKCVGGSRNGQVCSTADDCPAATEDRCLWTQNVVNQMKLDEVSVYDGVFQSGSHACCKPDLTCVLTDQANCTALGGVFHEDQDTCTATSCCNVPPADRDGDTDVDMADFAAIQRCLAVDGGPYGDGCACFDTNGNGTIDTTDVEKFTKCASGDGVPWAASPECP